jgi:hypothetical protein
MLKRKLQRLVYGPKDLGPLQLAQLTFLRGVI